jgi:hypothetical protein
MTIYGILAPPGAGNPTTTTRSQMSRVKVFHAPRRRIGSTGAEGP